MSRRISKHFNESEFECKHCGQVIIAQALVYALEAVREHFNAPVTINSGFRCMYHNMAVGGALSSYHMRGMAADIQVKGATPQEVYQFCDTLSVKGGVGLYKSFVHIDVRPYTARWIDKMVLKEWEDGLNGTHT